MTPIKGQGLPWQGGQAHGLNALDELAAAASQAHRGTQRVSPPPPSAPPSAALVDPDDSWDDDMPLNLRRPKVRPRAPEDEATTGLSQRLVKKPKARKPDAASRPARDDKAADSASKPGRRPRTVAVAPQDAIPVTMDKPLEMLLQEWLGARVDAAPPSSSSSSSSSSPPATPPAARWGVEQLADAIRRRVAHDNPTFKLSLLAPVLWRVLDLFGRLHGHDHERAVVALCAALGSTTPVAKQIGRMLVSHSERLGEQLGPTIRLAVQALGEAALFTPQPAAADGKAPQRTKRTAQHGTLLDEAIAMRPKLAGPVWRALFTALHERQDVAGIARVVETAVRAGDAGWQGLPVLFEALTTACGQGDMPVQLLERSAVHLLQPPSLELADGGGFVHHPQPRAALQALLRGVSAQGWKPAHLQALRALWQLAPEPAAVRARAEVLEPLLSGPEGSPLALAQRVREALEAAPGVLPDRLAARITGPFMGLLSRNGMTDAGRRSMVDILCANLVPALGRLDAAQARAVLQDLARRLADLPHRSLLDRLYEHLVRERIDRGLITFLLETPPTAPPAGMLGPALGTPPPPQADRNLHLKALVRGAIAAEPPLAAEEAQGLARMAVASSRVTPLSEQPVSTVWPQYLIRSLAHRDPALPPPLWSAWVLGHVQGLAERADQAYRLTTLVLGMAVDAASITAACAQATGRSIALGLGGPAMPAATLRSLLEIVLTQVRDARQPLSPRLLRPLLDGLTDGLGGGVMPDTLRAEVTRAVTAAAGPQPRVAGPGALEELEIFKTVLGGQVTPPSGSSSSSTTTSPVNPSPPPSSSSTGSSLTTASPPPSTPVVPPRSSVTVGPVMTNAELAAGFRKHLTALQERPPGDDAASAVDPTLKALLEAALRHARDDRHWQGILRKSTGYCLQLAVKRLAQPPLAGPAPSPRARQRAVETIIRTACSLDSAASLADAVIQALAEFALPAQAAGPGQAAVDNTWLAHGLAAGLQVHHDGAALDALVRAILAPARPTPAAPGTPPASRPAISDRSQADIQNRATGLRLLLRSPGIPAATFTSALATLLESDPQVNTDTPAQAMTRMQQHQYALTGMVGGVAGIPDALAAMASLPITRVATFMGLCVTLNPQRNAILLNTAGLTVLHALAGVPRAGYPLPALSLHQAIRLSLALGVALDRFATPAGAVRSPAAPYLLAPLFDRAFSALATPVPPAGHRIHECRRIPVLLDKPEELLFIDALRPQERVDLLCEMYELPRNMTPRHAAESLVALVGASRMPASCKLAGAVRLVRAVAPTLYADHLLLVRRELTEVVRGLALEEEAAAPAQREQARQRHAQAVAQVREVYANLLRVPLLDRVLTPGPLDPDQVALSAANLRDALRVLEAEIAELTRAHQPRWVAEELLPIAGQAHEAVRRALEVGQAAGKLPAKTAAAMPGDH